MRRWRLSVLPEPRPTNAARRPRRCTGGPKALRFRNRRSGRVAGNKSMETNAAKDAGRNDVCGFQTGLKRVNC